MMIVDPGHDYELNTLDGRGGTVPLTFVKREGPHYPGNVGSHPGTTSQEVLRALLDRALYVQRQIPCIETEMAIHHLQAVIALFEIRAKRVKGRHYNANLISTEVCQTCEWCGHVDCDIIHEPRV